MHVFSVTKLCLTLYKPWTVACQAPLSVEFPRQESKSGLSFPHPGDLPDPEIKPESPVSPALAGRFLPLGPPGKPSYRTIKYLVPFISASLVAQTVKRLHEMWETRV